VSDASGNVYHASPGRLRSFTADLDLRWNKFFGYVLGVPHPDPTDQVVVVNAAETYGVSGMALAVDSADGQEAWRVPFTPLPVGIHIGGSSPRFSPDGSMVYLNSLIAGPKPGDDYWYLNAIETDPTLINLPPTATDDSYQTLPGTLLTLPVAAGLLGNDNDPDGGTLLAAAVSEPANGTLMLDTAGSFQYMPNHGFTGTDTFTYQVSDGDNLSNVVEVMIEVTADNNNAPTAVNDNYTMQQDGTLVMAAPGVLDNDSDPDGDPLTAALETNPANGSVALNPDGSFTYTPDTGFSGQDTFTYQAHDGLDHSEPVTVTITVELAPPTGEHTIFMPIVLN
jgi:hypothetical protein